jgi:RNA polymerase sigma factor (TIGR02999 family)
VRASPDEVAGLLRRWRHGDKVALAELVPLVYDDLCQLARALLRSEAELPAPQPSALVHEIYLRLRGIYAPRWETRSHFYGFVARKMRQILIDHARTRRRTKRGQGAIHLPLEEAIGVPSPEKDLMVLSQALHDLWRVDPQQGRIVELRYFEGLTTEETATACGVSTATIKREWQLARVWLQRALAG